MPLTRSLPRWPPHTLVAPALVLTITVGGAAAPALAAPEAATRTYAATPESTESSAEPNPFGTTVGGDTLDEPGVIVEPTDDQVPELPEVPAQSYIVADLDSGDVLAAKEAHTPLRPSGTLSMLTALTLLPQLDRRAEYTVRADDTEVPGAAIGLRPGESYTVDDLFHGLFLGAGQDAAAALADASGGAETVTDQMSEHATGLGAFDTEVTAPTDADGPGSWVDPDRQRTSAYDLALLARSGLTDETFTEYATTRAHDFPELDRANPNPRPQVNAPPPGNDETTRVDTNNALLFNYPGALGVTAGNRHTTDPAIVGAAEADDRRLVVTVMGVDDPAWESAAVLLDWGFEAADDVEPAGHLVTPEEVEEAFAEAPGADPPNGGDDPADQNDSTNGSTTQPGEEPATTPSVATRSRVVGLRLSVIMLLGLAATFVVMAGTRVYTVLRARRQSDNPTANPND